MTGFGSDEVPLEPLLAEDVRRWVVALSGGMDSVALLHWLASRSTGKPVTAIHVNHGLHGEADRWQAFCEKLCRQLQLPLDCATVSVERHGSLELNARKARYRAFRSQLVEGDLLCLAHHADDQVETILLNLFRGSEAMGVRGMPRQRKIGSARLYRPFLDIPRDRIRRYCQAHSLEWVEDSSNLDLRPDRNFLRVHLLPQISRRFPAARQALLNAVSRDLRMREEFGRIAREDLDRVLHADGGIDRERVSCLSELRLIEVLRQYIGSRRIALPTGRMLRDAVDKLKNGRRTEAPLIRWAGHELRVHDGVLYLIAEPAPVTPGREVTLSGEKRLELSNGTLTVSRKKGQGVRITGQEANHLVVRLRKGGEKIRQGRSRSLKNIFQEHRVPVWLRPVIPLIHVGEELVALPEISCWKIPAVLASDRRVAAGEIGWMFEFTPSDRV